MTLTDKKLSTYSVSITNLSDTPNSDGITADQLKAMFDSRTDNEVKEKHNDVIDALVANTGAAEIGALKGLTTITVQGHISDTSNPHGVTNAQVGLGNVTNDKQATEVQLTAHTGATNNPHSVTASQVGLGDCDNTADLDKPISTATQSALDGKVDKVTGYSLVADTDVAKISSLGTAATKDTGTSSGDIPVLDASGKLDTSVLPALSISETFVVSSQDAMLALSAQTGDIAVRTDVNKSFILKEEPASTLANWQELLSPPDAVSSVNSKTGAVVISASDLGALTSADIINDLLSSATDKALSAAQGKALADALSDFCNNVDAVKYDTVTSKFQYTTDNGSTWVDLTGPQGIQGKGYNPRGAWVSGGSYTNSSTVIDVVSYNGSSYYCITSVSGSTVAPDTDTTNWGLLAQSGSAGTGADILITGYSKPGSSSAVAATDTVNQAIGKVEASIDEHKANTSNPHSVTAAQVGADPSGTASSAVSSHDGNASAHSSLFSGKSDVGHTHTYSEVGADASGTAASAVSTHDANSSAHTGLFDASGAASTAVSTHNSSATAHSGLFDASGAATSAVSSHDGNASAHSSLFAGKANSTHTHSGGDVSTTCTTVTSSTKTLSATDKNTLIVGNRSSTITVTVPASVFSAGDVIDFLQSGSGKVTLSAGTGVTLNSKDSKKSTNGQYTGMSLICTASNTFIIVGDLS